MADSVSIQPLILSGLAATSPLAFRRLGADSAAAASVDSAGSTVALSGVGLLLSDVSAFRSRLQVLQAAAVDTRPANVTATAQELVDAFNSLQGNTDRVQVAFDALSGESLTEPLARTSGELTATLLSGEATNLDRLRAIGIDVQRAATSATEGGAVTLSLDRSALNAAVAADAEGTGAVLAGATQSLIDLTAAFEVQVAGAAASAAQAGQGVLLAGQSTATQPGVGVATDLLQNLPTDTVVNDLQLTDLDLAVLGVNANDILSTEAVRQGALAAVLLNANGTATTAGEVAGLATGNPTFPGVGNQTAAPATPGTAQPAVPATPFAGFAAPAAPTANPAATAAPTAATLAATGNADARAADRSASDATLTLQILLADPNLRAASNFFDPVYSALIAASHLSDFVSPAQVLNPKAILGDLPAAVAPVAVARGLAFYNQAANEERQRA